MTVFPLVLALLLSPPATPAAAAEVLSLNLKSADIRDVALHLATFSGLSVVLGPEVQGSVTISLKNVTPELALSTILKVHGYASIREGRVLQIGSPDRLIAQTSIRSSR